jgi:hypothetical protein
MALERGFVKWWVGENRLYDVLCKMKQAQIQFSPRKEEERRRGAVAASGTAIDESATIYLDVSLRSFQIFIVLRISEP